jgi:hypothetical protein
MATHMTMGTARRLGAGHGCISQRQKKNRATDHGQHQATPGDGPLHENYFIQADEKVKGFDKRGG